MKPLVLLDVDGVLANFTAPVLAEINRLTDEQFKDENISGWDIYESLGVPRSVGDIIDKGICQPGFCAGLAPYPDAKEWLPKLREIADVHVVTAPFDSDFWHREREKWLQKEFGFSRLDITQTGSKNICFGDFLVDDKATTIENWEARYSTLGSYGVLFDRPWNRHSQFKRRANNWRHLVAMIQGML